MLTARLLRPDLFIIGRAETEDAKGKLVRAGADRVLSPYQIGGLQLAQTALRPAVVDFVQLATSSDNLELNMEQVQIGEGVGRWPDSRSSTPTCASVRRGGRRHPAQRRPDGVQSGAGSAMRAGDHLVVLGRPGQVCASSTPRPASRSPSPGTAGVIKQRPAVR